MCWCYYLCALLIAILSAERLFIITTLASVKKFPSRLPQDEPVRGSKNRLFLRIRQTISLYTKGLKPEYLHEQYRINVTSQKKKSNYYFNKAGVHLSHGGPLHGTIWHVKNPFTKITVWTSVILSCKLSLFDIQTKIQVFGNSAMANSISFSIA